MILRCIHKKLGLKGSASGDEVGKFVKHCVVSSRNLLLQLVPVNSGHVQNNVERLLG